MENIILKNKTEDVIWSHSRLNTILDNPMEYYLIYKQGVKPKEAKPALAIGSAVHWGIEHNKEDLCEYFSENGMASNKDNYTIDEILAEGMVHGYLKNKDEIFKEILTDNETGEQLTLLEEIHELSLTGELKSNLYCEPHKFLGIIDLLLLTNKGFIIIDYKTSSQIPDWSKYLDQIYRYVFLLRCNFPDTPVLKIGIINLKKTGIRQKKSETLDEFIERLKLEYEINDSNLINTHIYNVNELNENLINNYILNLSFSLDMAQMIIDNKMWFINFKNVEGIYGKSQFYDIYYKNAESYSLYKIRDSILNNESNEIEYGERDCVDIDMLSIDLNDKVMNKYYLFKKECENILSNNDSVTKENIFNEIKSNWKYNKELLETYWNIYTKEKSK